MPTIITLPACLMDCYKVMYPNLDFSRVASTRACLPAFQPWMDSRWHRVPRSPTSGSTSRTTSLASRTLSSRLRPNWCTSSLQNPQTASVYGF